MMEAVDAIHFHNAIADTFSQKYHSSKAFRERFRVWTHLLDRYIQPGCRVLDLGCGSGVFSYYLAHKGCEVIGMDGAEAMITRCRQQLALPNLHFVQQILPLPHTAVLPAQDAVIMSSVLEYIDDGTQLLQQVRTLLKPNGLLFVSIPNQESVYRNMERACFRLSGWPRYAAFIRHTSTAKQFNQYLTELGFDVLEMAYYASNDPISCMLKPWLPKQYVNNLLVGVYRKRIE